MLMDNAVLVHPFMRNFLLIEGVRFDLIDHGLYARERAQVYQSVGIKVGNADGAQLALRIQFLKRPPCAVIIGKRLMQQNEVEIIELHFSQRFQNGFFAFLVAVVFDPYLCGDEQFFAGNTRLFDGVADFLFVKVRLRRVDMAVADFQRVCHAALALLLRHLIHAVAELEHLYPVCKRYIFHNNSSF